MRSDVRPDARSTVPALAVLALAALFSACTGGPADGPSDAGPGRSAAGATEVVLLGTSHFAGSATDEHTSEVGDVLSETRQRELDEVAASLAEWGTDGLFVECTPDAQARIDSLYEAYRSGAFDPTGAGERGEIFQLGFRAADRSGLERTRCVDAEGLWLGSRARQVAREHNPEVLEGLERLAENRLDTEAYLREHTIGEYLVELNSEARLWENHKAYNYYFARMGSFEGSGLKSKREGDLDGATFALDGADRLPVDQIRGIVSDLNARIVEDAGPGTDYVITADREAAAADDEAAGADTLSVPEAADLVSREATTWVGFPDHHVGADLVGEWYKRNLRIYANVWRAVDEGDERVVVLVGAGHVWTLRTFLRENPDFEVVPVAEVL